jgi:hypothetical protein
VNAGDNKVFEEYGQESRRANKITRNAGHLYYRLFTDEQGALYFKIISNSDGGTHPVLLFSVEKYWRAAWQPARIVSPNGYSDHGFLSTSNDKDASGFIKAVIKAIPVRILDKFHPPLAEEKRARSKKKKKASAKK